MRKSTFSSCLLLLLIVSGTLAVAAEKRSLHPDSQLLARARQFGSQNSAAYRALFGLSQREDLKPLRSTADRNGVTVERELQESLVGREEVDLVAPNLGNAAPSHRDCADGEPGGSDCQWRWLGRLAPKESLKQIRESHKQTSSWIGSG